MLVFRLFRIGKNNQPSFKVVVTDKRNSSRGGRFVEQVGTYNPVTKKKVLNKERVQYWLKQGVKPSPTLYNFFIQEKILEGKKLPVHKKSKKAPAAAPAAEAPKPAEAPKAAEKTAEAKPQPKEEVKTEEAPKPAEKAAEATSQTAEAPKIE